MRVLVDTSVWIDHFRKKNSELLDLLATGAALSHPLVVGELRCGSLPNPRSHSLTSVEELGHSESVGIDEVIALIESKEIHGKGCGLVDIALLTSTLKTPGARLWALDRRLAALAVRLGVAHDDQLPRLIQRLSRQFTAASPTA